jgi:hypothetical protein
VSTTITTTTAVAVAAVVATIAESGGGEGGGAGTGAGAGAEPVLVPVPVEIPPMPLICKHCSMSFAKWRGFKRHVKLKHLKQLNFLCPYCDRSTNSEAVMLQHLRSKHRTLPEKILENPNPQVRELSPEFWEREYGLVIPKAPKKRKRKDENAEDGSTRPEPELPCDTCDFTAITYAGLKSHMRTHEIKVKQKCNYCTFVSFNSSEMRQHWEVNHAHLEFKVTHTPSDCA